MFVRMLRHGLLLALSALILSAPARADALRTELQSLADRADAAWNARDAVGLSNLYAEDASLTVGQREVGTRAAITAYYTQSLGGVPAGMRHRTVLRRLVPLGDYLITDNAVALETPDGQGGLRVVREFFTVSIVRKGAEGWQLVAVRATPLGPARPAP